MFYGAVVWDPWLIVSQIVSLQCLYYLTLGVFMSILVGTRVSRMSLVYFFDFSALTTSTGTGWCVIASFILSALAGTKMANGSLCEDKKIIAYWVVKHFKEKISADSHLHKGYPNVSFNQLNPKDKDLLEKEVSKAEIRKALKSCDGDRAPGVDGFRINENMLEH